MIQTGDGSSSTNALSPGVACTAGYPGSLGAAIQTGDCTAGSPGSLGASPAQAPPYVSQTFREVVADACTAGSPGSLGAASVDRVNEQLPCTAGSPGSLGAGNVRAGDSSSRRNAESLPQTSGRPTSYGPVRSGPTTRPNGPTTATTTTTPTEVAYAQAVSQLNEQYQITVAAYEQIIQAMKQEDDGSVRRIQELEGYW